MVPVALLLVASWAVAQPGGAVDTRRLLGQSDQTAKRLAEAGQTLAAGRAADALDQLLRVQETAGDDLVTIDGQRYRPARSVAQELLARLPPPVLRTYQDRVAGPAETLLATGRRDRDPRPLHTLLDRYFPAAQSEAALLLLGELLFERGEFRVAESCWRRLLPGDGLAVPTATTDPARVRALVVLAVIFQGEMGRAAAEVEVLRKEHPKATGRLAGVEGGYADTLAKLLEKPPRRPAMASEGEWTAFAGNVAHDGRATGRLPRYWPSRPTWTSKLPNLGDRPAIAPTPTARSLAYHPVALGGVGYVADPVRVFAIDLRTGAVNVAFDLRSEPRATGLSLEPGTPPLTADADFTLTAANGRLYGRFGLYPPATAPDPMARPTDFLVSLVPAGPGELVARWAVPPPAREGAAVAWEATPVCLDGKVFAAFTRLDGTTRTYAVAGYSDPPGEKPLWVTEVATAPAGPGAKYRQEPLTVAGGKLVYCTHAGSVVALDPATGKPSWAVKYPSPRRPLSVSGPPRDLCPPLAAGGRVFVAPNDAEILLALDAATGEQLWAADGLQVDQLLGVSRGRLVATIAGPQKGVRGFDTATGGSTGEIGWRQHDDPRLGSFGRGLVTDELVLWPTRHGLYPLDATTGRPIGQPLPSVSGNLAFADGVLLIGTSTGVAGFVPDRLRRGQTPRDRAIALVEDGRVDVAIELVKTAGLPDASRLAQWWRPTPPPVFATVDRPLTAPQPPAPPERFDPTSLTPLGANIAVGASTRFPAPILPLRTFDGTHTLPGMTERDPLLLVTDGPRVLAYRPRGEIAIWMTTLPAGVTVNQAAILADTVIVAGPEAVVRLDREDGRLIWAYAPPVPLVVGPRSAIPPLPSVMTDFVLVGPRVCCRYGTHTVLAINLADGTLAWARDGLFRRFEPFPVRSTPGFSHLVCPDGRRLLARRTDGVMLVFEPVHGDLLTSTTTAAVPWDTTPVWIGSNRVAVADGPDRVSVLEHNSRHPAWTAGLGGKYASLWGKPPQLRVAGGGLLVAVARSHGTELEYVRRSDGERWPQWSDEPTFLGGNSADLSAADSDAEMVFIPGGEQLTAVRLIDGSVAWQTPLPGPGRWQVRAGIQAVFLVPDSAVPAMSPQEMTGRTIWRFIQHPSVNRLSVILLGLYDAWTSRTLPVVRIDPATGRTLGRFDLPAVGPTSGTHLGPGPCVVVTAYTAYWLN